MEITAELRYHRIAPRKIRLVADLVRGKMVKEAISQLRFSKKKGAALITKLLKSAVSNAKNNFKIKEEDHLYIKRIFIDEGPTLKRYQPRARGRSAMIRKRTSHLTVILEEKK